MLLIHPIIENDIVKIKSGELLMNGTISGEDPKKYFDFGK